MHAGLHPAWHDPAAALADSEPWSPDAAALFATRVRYCDSEGRQPVSDDAPPGPPFTPWFEHYVPARHGGRTVVFGHWAAMGLVRQPHLRGLDKGCVWGHQLAAWIAEEDRLVHIPAQAPGAAALLYRLSSTPRCAAAERHRGRASPFTRGVTIL